MSRGYAVTISLLGRIEIRTDAGPRTPPRRGSKTLLSVLALRANSRLSVDWLIDCLWDRQPPSSALANLRNHVADLRRLLAMAGEGAPTIESERGFYLLRSSREGVDTLRMADLAVAGRAALADGRHADARDLLSQAHELWRGPVMGGLRIPAPVVSDVDRLQQMRLDVVEDLLDARLAVGHHIEVALEAREWLADHPFRERLWRQLLLALYRCGRQAQALNVYQELCQTLDRELGVRPCADTAKLHERILGQDVTLMADGVDTIEAVPGERVVPQELPAELADFTGRDEHVARLVDTLTATGSSARPVAAIAGLGGIGKTCLAIHVAHRVKAHFPDGHLYADLGGVPSRAADPGQVLDRFLRALGVDGTAIPADLEQRAALYRRQLVGKRVLVVLDNAVDDAQVRALLPGSESCRAVVTSRALLGATSETTIELDVLSTDEALRLLRRASAQLADAPATREIAELCGGIPLAVRIAGARIAAQPVASLASFAGALRDRKRRLDQLASGALEIRAGIEVSYESLSADARLALRLIGTLELGDCTTWLLAAAVGWQHTDAENALAELRRAQLVTATQPLGTSARWIRFRLHDLVRIYAAERAGIEDTDDRRHGWLVAAAQAYLALARRADEALGYGTLPSMGEFDGHWPLSSEDADDLVALPADWLAAETANLTVLVTELCVADPPEPELAWNLADACCAYYEMRDLYDDWRATHLAALEVADAAGRAVMARNLAYLSTLPTVQPQPMQEYAELARDLSLAADEPVIACFAVAIRGSALIASGSAGSGLRELRDAMTQATVLRDTRCEMFANAALGFAYREQARWDEAAIHLERTLDLGEPGRTSRLELMAMRSLGMAWHYQGRVAESEAILLRGLRLARRLRVRGKELLLLVVLGESYLLTGRVDEGHELLTAALALSNAMGSEAGHAVVWRSLGVVDLVRGRPHEAVVKLRAARDMLRQVGLVHIEALALSALGGACLAVGDRAGARESWISAIEIFRRLGNVRTAEVLTSQVAELAG